MRLQTLALIRYGKFSDRQLDFPRSDCDFHLVVGANEAGKSTLRRAVSELLFGMPLRSEMDFVHPLAELRLGAVIESSAGTLAFHRARGRKPLRRPDDEPLPEAELAQHLGGAGEALFNRMFCLDLAALIEGGKTILDAADDVGQLLFQSASGLGGLGAVRDALLDEANRLYAPRKSGERSFYQALERHDAARHALRGLTVNAKQWSAAMGRFESLQSAQQAAAAHYRSLSGTRQQLERIRRIAPRVAQLRDAAAQVQALAAAVEFPADAARQLADSEVAMATQSTTLALHRGAAAALAAQRAALTVDDEVLAQAGAIEALAVQAGACSQHRQKLARAEQEVQALLRDAASGAAQLGWPADEAALRARVPSSLALKTLGALTQQRGALLQAQQSAEDIRSRAEAAHGRLQRQQAAPAGAALSPESARALQQALQAALPLRAGAGRQRALQAAQAQAEAQLQAALAALSIWRTDVPALAALALPSEEQLSALKAERAALAATCDAAAQQHAQARERAQASALALAQFEAGHSLVTADEVQAARALRDGIWRDIKTGQAQLAAAAPALDQAIGEADRRVDRQRDHAGQAAQLLSLRHGAERDESAATRSQRQQDAAQQAWRDFDARWAAQAAAAGIAGMPLLDASGWLAQRRAALDAAATRHARALEQAAEQAAEASATAALQAALTGAGEAHQASDAGGGAARLDGLCARAEQRLADRQAAQASAESLARQLADAQAELDHHAAALQRSRAALAQWQQRWQGAVAAAALDGGWMTPDAAAGAVELASRVLNLLAQVDGLRTHRIQAMQQDLADFAAAARALPAALGAPADGADALAWPPLLAQRLQRAREAQQARQRLGAERQASEAQARAAEAALAASRAALAALYALAGSDDHALLRARIADSDRRRALDAELRLHRQAIVDSGDGLSLDALLAECAAIAPETLQARLAELDAQLSAAVDQQTDHARELAQAQAALDKLGGGDDAAVAESKRVESLAQLGDAAERYVTVATGHRLLRWAIDRYRERKQGPMLQRASTLFAQLTLGGFARLAPDFEVTPPRLIAVRATGERVGIGGLSEGTRDQLFLALRLAALEMQIDVDRPLPFIADDLFVNFHDSRSRAGLAALGALARKTQVIFLTHHEHLVEVARQSIGAAINVVHLDAPPHHANTLSEPRTSPAPSP